MSLRTPLARARGLGSAHDGTGHFWWQRVTAAANLLLGIFFVYSIASVAGSGYTAVRAYFGSPFTAALMILFVISVTYHMRLGMQVIIEDYVSSDGARIVLLVLNIFFCALIAMISILALLKLALGA